MSQRAVSVGCAVGLAALALLAAANPPATAQPSHRMRCSITNVVGPSFGGYDVLNPEPLDSAGYVSFRCDNVGASDMIAIELGRGRSNTFLPRRMAMRNRRLEYNLYVDAARTLVWGDGTRGTSRLELRPTDGRTESITIYGRIPPRQRVSVGSYSDQVMLTVQY